MLCVKTGFQDTKTNLEHMVIYLGKKKEVVINFPMSICLLKYIQILLSEFCSVFQSFACYDLLLITRCSCISKSIFLSVERERAVSWSL